MSDEDYGGSFITIEDDDGKEYELEHIDTLEANGGEYMLFLPADMDENDEDYGFIILKVDEVDGEELLSSVDDEQELSEIYDLFMEKLYAEEDAGPSEDE